MQEVMLSIPVKTNVSVTPEEIAKAVQRLIEVGLAGVGATLENAADGDESDGDAMKLATDLNIGAPVVAKAPRVLVVVSGGIADPLYDDGVDVEVFDWDNYSDDPKNTRRVPSHFADLAKPSEIPVEG
ncbi:hypothetical protein ACK249_005148 [Pseudomonas aeruginosa]|uniref:hypothetical protein n=1 Tax=Pseudomonas aeruginosa TaxID=287 RepID=UPI0025CAF4F0|nr:hypothetical protein [Pseudomonas aeruginosa]